MDQSFSSSSPTAMTTTTPSRLTRSALKKLEAARENMGSTAKSPVAARKSLFADDETERMVQDYEAFQHGLAPAKRRRVSRERDATDDAENVPPSASNVAPSPPREVSTLKTDSAVDTTVLLPEMQLQETEKAMDGAPEGELYVVTVLASSEIKASEDVQVEVESVRELVDAKVAGTSTGSEDISWAKEYAALDSVRRLALHHPDHLRPMLEMCLTALVCPAATNLRSAMARNALLCLQDIIGADSGCERHFGLVVPLLVHRMGNEKQFIRDLARGVLSQCVEKYPCEALLRELLHVGTSDKNAQIVGSAGVFVSQCILKMDANELKKVVEAREAFVVDMEVFLNCKVIECKQETRKTLQHVRKVLGETEFVTLVKSKLSGTAQFDLLKASELKKAPSQTKPGIPKMSMRERMLLAKKQQAASGVNTASDVVVAAPPPPASR